MRIIALVITAQKSPFKLCSSCCNDSRCAPATGKMWEEWAGSGIAPFRATAF